ncbi:zinc finger BED domain-containing protein RICESLEEPER 2-like protein [Tanacetum coccineum]|uniref:Zinc finger BED domain-containing protein RICESLEEPER 2-like protein n=1 Tax=Tanacetum coccineum TaxID=301880 RepID=A0ABQ5HQR2_9ASTR
MRLLQRTLKVTRSLVWRLFEKIEGATPADRTASCHNCGKVYCANPGSGTRNLKRHMFKCFDIQEDWGIKDKVFTITLDNAKYNDGLVETLRSHLRLNNVLVCDGKFIHVRCGAHVLNLIVQAGLKVIEGSIEKVRESVKYVRGSSTRKTTFVECIAHLQLQCGRLVCQDVVTRWNSTYMMLDCALVYQNAYARLDLVDSNYTCCPTPEEWTRIMEISKFLKPLYKITTLFSGNSYPTSNLYFLKVFKIQSNIEEAIRNSDPVISDMGKDMKTKFDKYWNDYCKVLSFTVIMDSRYKDKIIDYCFSKLEMTPVSSQEDSG